MRTSIEGRKMILHFEGYVPNVYLDQAGIPTVCVGHVVKPGEDFSHGATAEECTNVLQWDLEVVEDCLDRILIVPPTTEEQAALASLGFNIGCGALASSTVVRLYNAGDKEGAANAFLLWTKRRDKKTGLLVHDGGLQARRELEREVFLSGSAQAVAEASHVAYQLNFSLSDTYDMRTGEEVHEAA